MTYEVCKKCLKRRRTGENNNINSSKILRLNDNIAVFRFKKRRRRWRSRLRVSDGLVFGVNKTAENAPLIKNITLLSFKMNRSSFFLYFFFFFIPVTTTRWPQNLANNYDAPPILFDHRGRIDVGIFTNIANSVILLFLFSFIYFRKRLSTPYRTVDNPPIVSASNIITILCRVAGSWQFLFFSYVCISVTHLD